MYDNIDPDLDNIDPNEDYPTLVLVSRFARLIPRAGWFRRVGEPFDTAVYDKATAYLTMLGFADATPAALEDWQDAAASLESQDWNSPFWEAEQQRMAALAVTLTENIDPQLLEMMLTHINAVAAEHVSEGVWAAAGRWGIGDEELIKAAIGEGVQACYQAAMAIAAGEDADHPFALKYQLFESGFWPLGVAGATFNIF